MPIPYPQGIVHMVLSRQHYSKFTMSYVPLNTTHLGVAYNTIIAKTG